MLPTIALGIGVVVAGLGIGAFLSALQNRGPSSTTIAASTPSSLPAVTPVARATRGPIAVATMVAHPTPTPTPNPTPAPTATTAIPAATATPRPTASPRALVAAATPTPPPLSTATPRPIETPAPRVTAPPTARPTVRPTPRPTLPPTVPPTTVARVAQAAPTTQAEATVRRYLGALIAGNENAAYAALGASPGDSNAQLSEEAFIDRGTRITSMRTTSANQNGATVEVEMTSSRGSYFGTYHITNGPNGPVIDQHDYIKV
ncbi:MAG: hypothetical protein JWO85_1814 [Candidatus Eremiobacteraeota bacterium]|nr:hypothetical protein [Candidatus Eremiobacteraeota bacterium]